MENIRYSTINDIIKEIKELHKYPEIWQKTTFDDVYKATIRFHDPAECHKFEPSMYFPDMTEEVFIETLIKLPLPSTLTAFNSFSFRESGSLTGHGMIAHVLANYLYDERHSHDWFEIVCVLKGECLQVFEDEERVLREGNLSIISPKSRHCVLIYNDDCRAIQIALHKNVFDSTFFDILSSNKLLSSFFKAVIFGDVLPNYILFEMGNDKHFFRTIKSIFYEIYQVDSFSQKGAISGINTLFCHLLRNSNNIISYKNNITDPAAQFPQILLYMQKNYQKVTLQTLAQHFHYSESHLSRYIKASMGRNFSDIMRVLKLEKTKEYLINSNMSIGEITVTVGYCSQCYLTRAFKAEYGVSPQQFRTNQRRAVMP